MPSPRSIIIDIESKGLNPNKPHHKLTKDGHLAAPVSTLIVTEVKAETSDIEQITDVKSVSVDSGVKQTVVESEQQLTPAEDEKVEETLPETEEQIVEDKAPQGKSKRGKKSST